VSELTWTFVRGEDDQERLTIAQGLGVDSHDPRLTVTLNDLPRSYSFSDVTAARRFQTDMEAFLLRSGWSFIEFSPERRAGAERRRAPRILGDRRRWWTDGMVTVKQFLDWGE
jgi:hypothetical protein